MFDDAKRFLVLNCVLNGHPMSSAVNDDMEELIRLFETDKVVSMEKLFVSKEEEKFTLNPVVATLLNFFRTYQYAFITPTGSETMLLSDIVNSYRKGEIDEEIIHLILTQIIRDIAYAEELDDISIRDGILRVPRGITRSVLNNNLQEAFKLFCYGPSKSAKDPVLRYRNSLSVIGFKSFTTSAVLQVINSLLKSKYPPTSYRDTTLLIPDLLPLYKETDLIMCMSDVKSSAVDWLLPEPEKSKSTAVTVDYDVLDTLMRSSIHDLQVVEYGGSKVGLRVRGA